MAIYVATHKKFEYKLKKGYVPIQVGSALKDDLGYLRDDGGDNISEKNSNYCELTALYYIAKNRKKDKIVGLVHYRRYFFKGTSIISYKDAYKFLKKYDIILPYKLDLKESVEQQYDRYHHLEDLKRCGDIIRKIYPDYYDSFTDILSHRYISAFNMFIMKGDLFKEYAEWLFNILTVLEKSIHIESYDDYNKRIYGFLSERLFNVWINHKKLYIKYLPVYNVEEPLYKHVIDCIKGALNTFVLGS